MKKFLIMLFTLLVMANTVQAIPLQDLFDGQEIVVDDKRFFNWTLINMVSTNPALDPDYGLIDVFGISDALNPGLSYNANGQLTATDLDFVDLTFGFSIEVLDPGFRVKDNSLEITDVSFGDLNIGGLVGMTETVTDTGGNELAFKTVQADYLFGIYEFSDYAEFDPQSEIQVLNNILLVGDFQDDFVSLNAFEQRFSQTAVPEPGTLLLLAGGIAGLVAFRRKWR